MKAVSDIISENKKSFAPFISPLAKEWETVLFKAIDILHNLEAEGFCKTAHIKNSLLMVSASSDYDSEKIDKAIIKTREILEQDKVVEEYLKNVLEMLFAVKLTLWQEKNIREV